MAAAAVRAGNDSLRLEDRLGGHLVQGHVDGVATVEAAAPWLRVRIPPSLRRYVAEKGSIALDGVSLTVAAWDGEVVSVAVIPHTASATTLGESVEKPRSSLIQKSG